MVFANPSPYSLMAPQSSSQTAYAPNTDLPPVQSNTPQLPVMTSSSSRSFRCHICGKSFATKQSVECKKNQKFSVQCTGLGLTYYFLDHIEGVHNKNNRFPCLYCGKTFPYPQSRNRHQNSRCPAVQGSSGPV